MSASCGFCFEPLEHEERGATPLARYAHRRDRLCPECREHVIKLSLILANPRIDGDDAFIHHWVSEAALADPIVAPWLDPEVRVRCPCCLSGGQYGLGFVHPRGLWQHIDGRRGSGCRVYNWMLDEALARRDRRRAQEPVPYEFEPEYQPPSRAGFVYLIEDETRGHVKIGISQDPGRRLRDLSAAHSVPLRLVRSVKVEHPRSVEREMHGRFTHLRLNGEWFQRCDEILAAFTDLEGAA